MASTATSQNVPTNHNSLPDSIIRIQSGRFFICGDHIMKKYHLIIVNAFLMGILCFSTAFTKTASPSQTLNQPAAMQNKSGKKQLKKNSSKPAEFEKIAHRLVKKGNKAMLEFKEPVQNLIIFDSQGKSLQTFKKGRSFDITRSVKKNGGKNLKLQYSPASGIPKSGGSGSTGVLKDGDRPFFMLTTRAIYRAFFESLRNLDRNEPDNNTINHAVNAISGRLTGEVGDGDTADFFYIRTGGSGFGMFFQIQRTSGNVNLHLYGPTKGYLDWDSNKVWIAVTPNTTFYVQVEPRSAAATEYEINVTTRPVVDALEPNDTLTTAKPHTSGGNKVLCNLFTRSGDYVGIKDYFKFTMNEEKLVRASISNAGLGTGQSVSISLYDNNNTHHTTATGNANSATLTFDLRGQYSASWPPFPAGEWKILVTANNESYAKAYGTGDGPRCFTNASGYTFRLDLTD